MHGLPPKAAGHDPTAEGGRGVTEALFEPVDDGLFLPTDASRGPWSRDALHGGPVAALLAGAADATLEASTPGLVATRLTIELLRPVPVAPLRVEARVVRPGRKVHLADADLFAGDDLVATARLLRVREADVDAPLSTDVSPPTLPDTLTSLTPEADWPAFHTLGVEHRFVRGAFEIPGPATDWIRLKVPVIPGVEPTPLQRVAAASDYSLGISRLADFEQLLFINPDLTIHLHRLPAGEWICLDAVTWMERNGRGLAESRLFDERGPLGRTLQSLLVEGR